MNVKKAFQTVCIFILGLGLLGACSQPSFSKDIGFIVDGVEIEGQYGTEIKDGKLMVAASFIEQVLDMQVEWSQGTSDLPVYYSDRVAVLMYHDMSEEPGEAGTIQVKQFERQMELLRTNGFHPISIDEYVSFMLDNGTVPDNAVLLTFDDGYETFYKYAFPILKEYDYPAVNFVIVSGIDDPNLPGRPKLSWQQMREMQPYGMSFYNHTYDLHHYIVIDEEGLEKPAATRKRYIEEEKRTETNEEYTQRIRDDLSLAEQRLQEELGNTHRIMAFPYGAYNDEVLGITQSLGIELSFTIKEGINSREDKNGYRINGELGEKAEELIEKLKSLGTEKPFIGESKILKIDGVPVDFPEWEPPSGEDEVMIPLRAFCQMYGLEIDWDNKRKQVKLSTSLTEQ